MAKDRLDIENFVEETKVNVMFKYQLINLF